MENVTAAASSWLELSGTILATITASAILCFYFAYPLVLKGINILRKFLRVGGK